MIYFRERIILNTDEIKLQIRRLDSKKNIEIPLHLLNPDRLTLRYGGMLVGNYVT